MGHPLIGRTTSREADSTQSSAKTGARHTVALFCQGLTRKAGPLCRMGTGFAEGGVSWWLGWETVKLVGGRGAMWATRTDKPGLPFVCSTSVIRRSKRKAENLYNSTPYIQLGLGDTEDECVVETQGCQVKGERRGFTKNHTVPVPSKYHTTFSSGLPDWP